MVGCVGQPKGWPGSLMTGSLNPAQFTTLRLRPDGGGGIHHQRALS
ncbi:hypothetical protein ACR9GP_24605 [Enterobacter ludwigii]